MKNTYTLINGYILDGSKEMKPVFGNVEVIDGIISRIGNFNPTTKEIIDCKSGYILPGLINLHAHLPSSGKVNLKRKLADSTKLVNFIKSNKLTRILGVLLGAGSAKKALLSGVTTVRAVGGVSDFDSMLRDKINSKKAIGPRLIVANTAIGPVGGHMDGTVAMAIKSNDEIADRIKLLKEEKADFVKIMITGGVLDCEVVGKPGILKMKPDMVKAICDEAHKNNLYVAAHVESPEGIEVAIKGGVDTIEHGAVVNDSLYKEFKDRNGAFVITLTCALCLIKLDSSLTGCGEDGKTNGNVILNSMIENGKLALKHGIRVGLGTDAGCPYTMHYDFYREVYNYSRLLNLDPKFAIHSATLVNANIAGIDSFTGSIEANKCADIIVVKENPLEDLRRLKDISFVSTNLTHIKNPKVKKIKGYEEVIDEFENKL